MALFQPREAIRYRTSTAPASADEPEYPINGAHFDLYFQNAPPADAKLEVADARGQTFRTWSVIAAGSGSGGQQMRGPFRQATGSAGIRPEAGMQRLVWDLRYPGPWSPNAPNGGPGGPLVPPGKYTVKLTAGGQSITRTLELQSDPRIASDGVTDADITEQVRFQLQVRDALSDARKLQQQIEDAMQKAGVKPPASMPVGLSPKDVKYDHPLQQAWAQVVDTPGIYVQGMLINQLQNVQRMICAGRPEDREGCLRPLRRSPEGIGGAASAGCEADRIELAGDPSRRPQEGVASTIEQIQVEATPPFGLPEPGYTSRGSARQSPHPPRTRMEGRTVSHFRITERLGGGGMGIVYKAIDTRLDRPVALKFLPPDLTRDDDARARLIQEAKAASALDHPNICTVHDIDTTPEGQLFIAMAFYDGETLKRRIARGPMTIVEALDVTLQVAQGLTKAHAAGIIHRDIKPANLMITSDGVVKIVDFGIAKVVDQTGATRTGVALGTVTYMSPEQLDGAAVDGRTDVWSLGTTLYEMLTGRPPFDGDSALAVMNAIGRSKPVAVKTLRGDVPEVLARIVDKTMQKSPADRFASAADLVPKLTDCRQTLTGAVVVPDSWRAFTGTRAVAASVIAALAIAGGIGWTYSRNATTRSARERIGEISKLVEQDNYTGALRVAWRSSLTSRTIRRCATCGHGSRAPLRWRPSPPARAC